MVYVHFPTTPAILGRFQCMIYQNGVVFRALRNGVINKWHLSIQASLQKVYGVYILLQVTDQQLAIILEMASVGSQKKRRSDGHQSDSDSESSVSICP